MLAFIQDQRSSSFTALVVLVYVEHFSLLNSMMSKLQSKVKTTEKGHISFSYQFYSPASYHIAAHLNRVTPSNRYASSKTR